MRGELTTLHCGDSVARLVGRRKTALALCEDHRLDSSVAERERVSKLGGKLARAMDKPAPLSNSAQQQQQCPAAAARVNGRVQLYELQLRSSSGSSSSRAAAGLLAIWYGTVISTV